MQWTNLHYLTNPALGIAKQKNDLMAYIESAKQAQQDRHHYELLNFQNAKMMMEERLGLKKLDNEQRRHEENLQFQKEQISNQLEIANIQANNQLEIQKMQSNSQLQSSMFAHFSALSQQTNQAMMAMLLKMADNIIDDNKHQREMERQTFLSRIELIKIKLNNKHQEQMRILEHNLLLVEKRLDSDLSKSNVDFDKYSTVFYKLVERALDLSNDGVAMSDSDIERYARDLFEQVNPNKDYSPYG